MIGPEDDLEAIIHRSERKGSRVQGLDLTSGTLGRYSKTLNSVIENRASITEPNAVAGD